MILVQPRLRLLVEESRDMVIYRNPECEGTVAALPISYCYVSQLSIFQVWFKSQRDEQLLSVFPASSDIASLLTSTILYKEG